jgi:maltooligosyltrehalose trehalohydrolase
MWLPSLGAWPDRDGAHFRVWAPTARNLEVVLESSNRASGVQTPHILMTKSADGTWSAFISGVKAGDRYRYRVDGQGPFPDPASRFQPEGTHGPSEIIDPNSFVWSDAAWRGVELNKLIIYELHVGTFTPAGTFAGVRDHLKELVELGVTAIELMPVADFPGQRNWGYDGVDLFAPARCYGQPDDLRRLVDAAHGFGLAVLLDVVYNHLGPDGNYLSAYSPYYFSKQHPTTWGAALNLDGPHSEMVRAFFIENALHWITEYHLDGLRLDATHALVDEGPRHLLLELSAAVHHSVTGRRVLLIAEDHRNLRTLLTPEQEGGWGIDAVWADDFHHQVRRLLAGDHEGYYRDYAGTVADLVETIQKGWFYSGQHSEHWNEPRGTESAGIPPYRFVYCLQNHDQIGNRAMGERLHHQIDLAAYRTATALLLCCPATPLLFMGQEWAASTPFLFFTDHHKRLGQKVTEGRRQEFKNFSAFSDPGTRDRIPDPQAESTFLASKLIWEETSREPHASIRRLYQALLRLRNTEPALSSPDRSDFEVATLDDSAILLVRHAPRPQSGDWQRNGGREPGAGTVLIIVQLLDGRTVDLHEYSAANNLEGRHWQTILTTEDQEFCTDPRRPEINLSGAFPVIRFFRPSAVILREE